MYTDPERLNKMRLYAEVQKKLDKFILNKAKIGQNPSSPKNTPKSAFRWPSTKSRIHIQPDYTGISTSYDNWAGIGTGIQSTFGIRNIFRITGTLVVPEITVPPNSECSTSNTIFISTAWIGLGGDSKTTTSGLTVYGENKTLYQAGIDLLYFCIDQSTQYSVWYEDVPKDTEQTIITDTDENPTWTLSAGDTIELVVSYNPNDYDSNGSTMHVSVKVTSDSHTSWDTSDKPIEEEDPTNPPPVLTAEAISERECNAVGAASSYCGDKVWYNPVAYPHGGGFTFYNLKYSLAAEVSGTVETALNRPYILDGCQDIVQNPQIPNQCTVNIIYTMATDSCDSVSASVASDTSTNFTYVAGASKPNEDNGLCVIPDQP